MLPGVGGFAQEFVANVQQFDLATGLMHRKVNAIAEDANGFVWLGFSNGVQRFDGREYKTWSSKNGATELFNITNLYVDNAGWLWAWNNSLKKFVFIHTLTDEVVSQEIRFPQGHLLAGLAGLWFPFSYLQSPPNDSKGRLYFLAGHPNRLLRFDAKEDLVTHPLEIGDADKLEGILLVDEKDHIWALGYAGQPFLLELDADGEVVKRVSLPAATLVAPVGVQNGHLIIKLATKMGTLYLGVEMQSGVVSAPISVTEEDNTLFINPFVWSLDSAGWNLERISKPGEIASQIKLDDKWSKSLFFSSSPAFQDKRGRIWLYNEWGISRVEIKRNLFLNMPFATPTGGSFDPAVRGMIVQENQLLVVLEGEGLARVPLDNPSRWTIIEKRAINGWYGGGPVLPRKEGGFVVGGSYLRKREMDGSVRSISPSQHEIFTYQNWALYEDETGNLWAGATGEILKLEPSGHLERFPVGNQKLGPLMIYSIHEVSPDMLWLCTTQGIILFGKSDGKPIHSWGRSKQGIYHLPVETIFAMHIDRDSTYWLATDEGLLKWNPVTNAQELFSTIDGLSSDVIYSVIEDDYNNLWLSSENGLMCFQKETRRVTTFHQTDGILYDEFNRISAYKAADGRIFYGGLKGVTSFHPRDFNEKTFDRPTLQITDFEMFDGEAKQLVNKVAELRRTQSIVLQPNDGYFRLRFVIPNPSDEKQIRYGWRLIGKNEDWIIQKENHIQLAGLPYGDFLLEIKGLDQNGVWTDTLGIKIFVVRPFYLRAEFLVLMFLLLVFAIVTVFVRRNKLLRKRQMQLELEIAKATDEIRRDKQMIEHQAEELQSLDKAKSRFFANVAHEFRTPITLIQGPIGSLLKWPQIPEQQRQLLILAYQNTQSLLKLVGAVLDLSKLESGKMQLVEKPVSLFVFTRRIAAAFESQFAMSGTTFLFHYEAEESLEVLLDAEKVETILRNLISNAAKFTKEGQEVRVSVDDTESHIRIRVSDTGRGILPQDLPFIFDRFYQTSQADAAIEGGTGIGLALSQENARLMHANLTVDSEWGKGSTFTLRIPRKEVLGVSESVIEVPLGEERIVPDLLPRPQVQPSGDRQFLMIVEDHPALRAYLSQILASEYGLYVAENGYKAIELLTTLGDRELPSLILSDVMMPEMDGYQLLEKLKASPNWWQIPVIMLTARADMQDKLKALRIGVDDYLLKPFDEDELLARIRNLLHNVAARAGKQRVNVEPEPDGLPAQALGEADQKWLEKVEQWVLERLDGTDLSVAGMAEAFAMSESTLLRQVKRLTGLTPVGYLAEHKLAQARRLLEKGTYRNVADVAYAVGFEDAKAFSRSFKSRYGKSPSELLH